MNVKLEKLEKNHICERSLLQFNLHIFPVYFLF